MEPAMHLIKRSIVFAAALVPLGAPCFAGEADMMQLRGMLTSQLTQHALAELGTPIPLSSLAHAVPTANMPIGPGAGQSGNFAYTLQQGNNNFAAISQAGRGNSAQVFQIGNRNAAVVMQSAR
jgi:hypothetical protein